jgi:hypothetical protein
VQAELTTKRLTFRQVFLTVTASPILLYRRLSSIHKKLTLVQRNHDKPWHQYDKLSHILELGVSGQPAVPIKASSSPFQ